VENFFRLRRCAESSPRQAMCNSRMNRASIRDSAANSTRRAIATRFLHFRVPTPGAHADDSPASFASPLFSQHPATTVATAAHPRAQHTSQPCAASGEENLSPPWPCYGVHRGTGHRGVGAAPKRVPLVRQHAGPRAF
jgi:hypothetical protein